MTPTDVPLTARVEYCAMTPMHELLARAAWAAITTQCPENAAVAKLDLLEYYGTPDYIRSLVFLLRGEGFAHDPTPTQFMTWVQIMSCTDTTHEHEDQS